MPKNSTAKSAKKRVKVEKLSTAETKLSDTQMKKVKGGFDYATWTEFKKPSSGPGGIVIK